MRIANNFVGGIAGVVPALRNFIGLNGGRESLGSMAGADSVAVKASSALGVQSRAGIFIRSLLRGPAAKIPVSAMTAGALLMLNAMPSVAQDRLQAGSVALPETPEQYFSSFFIVASIVLNFLSITKKRTSVFTWLSTIGIVWAYSYNEVILSSYATLCLAWLGFMNSNDGSHKSKQEKSKDVAQKI